MTCDSDHLLMPSAHGPSDTSNASVNMAASTVPLFVACSCYNSGSNSTARTALFLQLVKNKKPREKSPDANKNSDLSLNRRHH
jgi:hypothetical protein